MSPALAILIIVVATAIAVAAILIVRRKAPEGSYFADGDRAAGGFGVLATGFSVLLGLIIFLAFSSYDDSRSGAETEALVITQQYETAQFLPKAVRADLSSQLTCYARSVVFQEWPRLDSGQQNDDANPWGVELFKTLQKTKPRSVTAQSAYDHWLDLTAAREEARKDRIHGAVGVIPDPLWAVLLFIALVIFGYMLFFADSAELARSQAVLAGSVTAVIVAMLLLIQFLDDPYRGGVGGLQPVAMERTLGILDQEQGITGQTGRLPCDEAGIPSTGGTV